MKGIVEEEVWYKVYYKDYPFWFRWHQTRDHNEWNEIYFNSVDVAIDIKRLWWQKKQIVINEHRTTISGKKQTGPKEETSFASIDGLEAALEKAYTKSVTKSQPTYAIKCSAELESTL